MRWKDTPIASILLPPFHYKTLWSIYVSGCVRFGGNWMAQTLGHILTECSEQLAAYHAWMASPLKASTAPGPPHLLPRYLQLELRRHVFRNNAPFHLHAHTLSVETQCWQIRKRHSNKCGLKDQDEKNVLFYVLGWKCIFEKEICSAIYKICCG